jgi:hypothetical protein
MGLRMFVLGVSEWFESANNRAVWCEIWREDVISNQVQVYYVNYLQLKYSIIDQNQAYSVNLLGPK